MPAQPGQLLNNYRVLGVLGKGAQGVVYLVQDQRQGQKYAAKVASKHPLAQERLRRESQALSLVQSPYVVGYVQGGLDRDVGWVQICHVVPGVSLARMATGLPLWTPQRLGRLCWQAAQGITAIHQSGMLMRDLAPSQVVVHQKDSELNVCLVDLGLARRTDVPSDLTEPGAAPGTPGFTAPEWVSEGTGTTASDTYSLAALVWWVLSGKAPFGAAPAELTFALQLMDAPEPLDLRALGYTLRNEAQISQLLTQCLSPDPSARPRSPEEFAKRLTLLLNQ